MRTPRVSSLTYAVFWLTKSWISCLRFSIASRDSFSADWSRASCSPHNHITRIHQVQTPPS
jgi:hypothetical protein